MNAKPDALQTSQKPEVGQLNAEFKRSSVDKRSVNRVRDADETRFAIWDGQSDDGKKHAADMGKQPFPWENASDTRIRLADEICNHFVNLTTEALQRAALNVEGVESGDHKDAQAVAVYLRWMTKTLMAPEWEEEMELHADYAAQYGWSVLNITWDRCYAHVPRRITLKSLAGFMGIQQVPDFEALTAVLRDREDFFADLLVGSNPGLTRRKAIKHMREVINEGETMFDVPEQVRNQPCIVALRPFHEVLFPPETSDWQRARAIFRRDYYTVAEIEAKAATGEWERDWCEKAKLTAGMSSVDMEHGLSPIVRHYENPEERANLIEVIHAYSRRSMDDGLPGIWLTTFSPFFTKADNGTTELHAEHRLVTEAGDTYPFEVFTREKMRRNPVESRGVCEIVKTWQAEYKAQADMVFDRGSFDTLPPMKVPLRYGQRIKIGPGMQIPEQRPGDIDWMQPPDRGAELSFELMKQVQMRADRFFGRPNPDIMPVDTSLTQSSIVRRWLRHVGCVTRRVWDLVQKFDSDERFGDVTGTGGAIPRDPGRHNFILRFDPRELDPEFVDSKLQAISQWIVPEDTMGIVNRTELLRMKLTTIDPTLPDRLIIDNAEASEKMFKEVNAEIMSMALGNQPNFVENDPSASVKAQFVQQILQANQKYQKLLQADKSFQDLLKAYMQNLQMSMMQQQNKMIGRIGVNPNQTQQ